MIAMVVVWGVVVGPGRIESALYPVATTVRMEVQSRTNTELCWKHFLIKHRDARTLNFVWIIADADRPAIEYAATAYIPETNESVPLSGAVSARRDVQHYDQCFVLPPPLAGVGRKLIFRASADYQVKHGLWTVPRQVGPIYVEGMNAVR
jgi:hypothetical protein